ncbi:unnamed protein product [Schistosoma rodhaini]|nr:unnamed protein product [Schistosoma rodhaini]
MLIYSELLPNYMLKDNPSKYDHLNNAKEKRLPRFALSEKNKNRQLYETQINFIPESHIFTMNTSQVATMIHSYRLPMFPTLLPKLEINQNYYNLNENQINDNDDTDSYKSHITLVSIANSNKQVTLKNIHPFSNHLLLKNEIINKEQINNTGKYDSIENDIKRKEIDLLNKEIKTNWKPGDDNNNNNIGSNDLSNRIKHIDELFCEVSRKMYYLSEENGLLMNNLFKATEHLKHLKNILNNSQEHRSTLQHNYRIDSVNRIENSSHKPNNCNSSTRYFVSPYQFIDDDNLNIHRLKLKTGSLHENLFSFSQPNLNQDVNDCNLSEKYNTDNGTHIDHHQYNSNNSDNNIRSNYTEKTRSDIYKTKVMNTNEHSVQKIGDKLLQHSQTSRISQIFTKANHFSTINLTSSLFRNASKERYKRRLI